MKWRIKGADRTTGEDREITVDAPSEEEAVKTAGTTLFIESVELMRPPPPIPDPVPRTLPPPRRARRPSNDALIAFLVAVIALIWAGVLSSRLGDAEEKLERYKQDVIIVLEQATQNSLEMSKLHGRLNRVEDLAENADKHAHTHR